MILNEDWFDEIAETGDFKSFEQQADIEAAQGPIPDVEAEVIPESEIKPEGPEQGMATGIANIIHDLLIDENEAIQGYNNAAANMEDYPELQKIMHDIAGEEFAHIGELEKALEIISPNAANIEEGEVESEENLDPGSPVDEALNEGWKSFDFDDYDDDKVVTVVITDRRFSPMTEPWQREILSENNVHIDTCFLNGVVIEGRVKDIAQVCIDCRVMSPEKIYESLNEDTEKKSNGKWTNKGSEGEHGEFKTKKEADDQRKAMFANGFHEDLKEAEEVLEALNISDDYRALKVIDKAIRNCEAAKGLTISQCEEIADAINDALHSISVERKNKK